MQNHLIVEKLSLTKIDVVFLKQGSNPILPKTNTHSMVKLPLHCAPMLSAVSSILKSSYILTNTLAFDSFT